MIKFTLIILLLLFASGCEKDIFNTQKVQDLQRQKEALEKKIQAQEAKLQAELEEKKLLAQTNLEQAKLQKELELEKKRLELEKKKELEIEKAKIDFQKNKELELIKQKIELTKNENQKEIMLYLFLLLALITLVVSFFLYIYFKRRRENKLRAYEDNLQKYFIMKEQEMRLKITDKILDTVKDSSLSSEDQKKLIALITDSTVEKKPKNEDVEIEFIEHKER